MVGRFDPSVPESDMDMKVVTWWVGKGLTVAHGRSMAVTVPHKPSFLLPLCEALLFFESAPWARVGAPCCEFIFVLQRCVP